jgi:competence ComEA-like helix-hairpin-helix protein
MLLMRKQRISLLVILTLIFAAFIVGFFVGRSQNQGIVSVSAPSSLSTFPTTEPIIEQTEKETEAIVFPVNINTASKEEYMALPGIGEVLAERILSYREEHGNFDAPENLLSVEGIGKKKLEEILDYITIGG